jgi:hypothetical protein
MHTVASAHDCGKPDVLWRRSGRTSRITSLTGIAATSAPGLRSPLPHLLHRAWVLPLPHLHQDWARRCHICTGTGLVAATSAPGPGSPLPHRHRDWARRCHICTGTGLTPATSAPGLGSPLPHRHQDWARRRHTCTGTGLTAATSAPGLGSPLPHRHRDWVPNYVDDRANKMYRKCLVTDRAAAPLRSAMRMHAYAAHLPCGAF